MKTNFSQAHEWLSQYEGGYVNHPKDPGGATNRGVTQRVYTAWRKQKGLSPISVRNITTDEVATLMHDNYWVPAGCNHLPTGVDVAVYDFAVNSGVSRAAKELQKIVGAAPDGIIGAMTIAEIMKYCNALGAEYLVSVYCNARLRFVQGLAHYETFGTGWKRRIKGSTDEITKNDYGIEDRAVWLIRYTAGPNVIDKLPPATPVGGAKAPDPAPSFWGSLMDIIKQWLRGELDA